MKLEKTRFGRIEIKDDAVLEFGEGLIGLPGKRWALLSHADSSAFMWLQSVDHPPTAVPVTLPGLFFSDYEVSLSDADAELLGIERADQAEVFCVVRAAERIEDFTINLRGPIVVHGESRRGRQIINELAGYSARQPLFRNVEMAQVKPASPAAPMAATGI